MKKLLVILIVLLLALIPFVSHAQQGSGTHPQLGDFEAILLDNTLRVNYGNATVVLMNVTVRKNNYTLYPVNCPKCKTKEVKHFIVYYYGEMLATIVDGDATIINTPWLGLEPTKASND